MGKSIRSEKVSSRKAERESEAGFYVRANTARALPGVLFNEAHRDDCDPNFYPHDHEDDF